MFKVLWAYSEDQPADSRTFSDFDKALAFLNSKCEGPGESLRWIMLEKID